MQQYAAGCRLNCTMLSDRYDSTPWRSLHNVIVTGVLLEPMGPYGHGEVVCFFLAWVNVVVIYVCACQVARSC